MTTTTKPRHLNLYRRYFELVAAGEKSVEVRVRSPRLAGIAPGDTIRFHIRGTSEACDVRVTRVAEYPDFEALLDGEGPENVNPNKTREQQLASIRSIYGPEREALGALAIGIELMRE